MSEAGSQDALRPSAEFMSAVERKIAARRSQSPAPAQKVVPPAPQSVRQESQDGYELAAAVLAWFEPDELRPLANAPRTGNVADLVARCAKSADESGDERWALAAGHRIEALKVLREKGLIPAALAANKRTQDPVQLTLDAYLTGSAKKIEEQTLAELASTHQVCDWLRCAGFTSIPTVQAIVQRVEWLSLLNPFEHVASDSRFRGRQKELAELREYAGVLPPGTRLQTVKRVFESILDLREKPPLLIVGVGGVGKSTLVSRFILEHARALEAHRFPFAYLDFDRAEINPSEPLTLLIEAVRQLGIEYPQARMQCDSLGRMWSEAVAESRRTIDVQSKSVQTASSVNQALEGAIDDFAAMVTTLGAKDAPVLFVLDTFEEVQWYSAGSVNAIWDLLERMQAVMPRLRVVLAGRADIEGKKTRTLALSGFDPESAVAYLLTHGVTDKRVAKRVAQQIGGSPLSLQLAAELYRQEGADADGDLAISTRTSLFFKMDSSLLQRQLYTRVLSHVHDPNVRKLAHPGLVLRRITPDLILKVLAEPCGIPIQTKEDAQRLFNALKREVALVSVEPDGAVRHRRDLRLVMVELLRVDSAVKVQEIHKRAVAYYESQSTSAIERAEEIYHRLSLDQDPDLIAGRWVKGVEPLLTSAMEEFTGRRRAWLASRLGLDIDAATRQLARLEDWESIALRDAEQLLASGQAKTALEVIRARPDRPAVGPLVSLEARALIQSGLSEEALDVAERGFDAAIDASNREFAVALALQAADIMLASNWPPKEATIERLKMMRKGALSPEEEIAILARSIVLEGPANSQTREDDLQRLRQVFDAFPDEDLASHSTLAYWAASIFEAGDVSRLARVISLCGLPRGSDAELRGLGSNLTYLDVLESRRVGEPEGMIARKLEIPIQSSLTVSWGDYLLRAPEDVLRKQLSGLLVEYSDRTQIAGVVLGTARVMQAALGFQVSQRPANVQPNERPRGHVPQSTRPDDGLRKRIAGVVRKQFTLDTFTDFVHFRLNRRTASLSISDNLGEQLGDVLQAAESQGWLDELVSQLVNARPDDPELSSIAKAMGIRAEDQAVEAIVRNSGKLRFSQFNSFINDVTPRIARVMVRDTMRANGFLIGPDLLLTADHALHELFEEITSSQDVSVVFSTGSTKDSEVRFPLDRDWLVARSESRLVENRLSGLGYAVLRVAQSPGAQPLGGSRAEAAARLRQWFDLPADDVPATVQARMFMISWGAASAPSSRFHSGSVLGADYKGLISHDVTTDPYSSGAPCFSEELRLLGMHLGSNGERNFAVSIEAIRADLADRMPDANVLPSFL
jgi:hypothetical protein